MIRRPVALLTAIALLGCTSALAPRTTQTPAAGTLAGPEVTADWVAAAGARLPMLERCDRPNVAEPLLCGSMTVPEDRTKPDGRTLDLALIVVPAQNEAPPADAVFVFEGGPGGAVTKRAAGSVWAGPVRQRDIVLVDQRGTSGSGKLDCDFGTGTPRLGELAEMYPSSAVAECARELSKRADLRRYTSVDHADDIEAVRAWLGYESINLRGGSYGTRAMMVYALRYPNRTRTLFGIGVDSPLRSNLSERGVQTETTLQGLSEFCAARPDCARLTPALHNQLGNLLASLDGAPRHFEIADPGRPDERLDLAVGREWLAEKLRLNLYFAFTTQALPFAVQQASTEDDWQPLLQLAVLVERMFKSNLAAGLALTVQCSEGMDFDQDAALLRDGATLFGNYRLAQQIQGCSAWPHDTAPPLGLDDPQPHPAPALWLSGAFDPVTPPVYAEDASTLFPRSLHVVLEEGQHGPFDLEGSWACVHSMWGQLLDMGSVDGLDTSCAQEMLRPAFIATREAFDVHVTEVLAPMAQ